MITCNPKHSQIVLVNNLIKSSLPLKESGIKITNFGSVFRPLHYLSRISGIAPFSIVTNSNGDVQKPKIHIHDGLLFLTMICIYGLFSIHSYNRFNLSGKSYLLYLCAYLFETFTFAYGILMVIMNVCNRFKLIEMLKTYIRFDKEVRTTHFCSTFFQ